MDMQAVAETIFGQGQSSIGAFFSSHPLPPSPLSPIPAVAAPSAPPPITPDTKFLDDLLEQGEDYEKGQDEPEAPNSFDFLTSLISESLEEQATKKELKEKRKLASNTSLPGSLLKKLRSEVQELEAKANWTNVADAVWVRRCICDECQQETPQFVGYFRRQRNRHMKVDRWVRLDCPFDPSLPRQMKTEVVSIPLCEDCLPQMLMEGGWLQVEAEEGSSDEEVVDLDREPADFDGEANLQDRMATADEAEDPTVAADVEPESPEDDNYDPLTGETT